MVGIAADQVRVVHNLKTGKTLGIKISDDLLLQCEAIELGGEFHQACSQGRRDNS